MFFKQTLLSCYEIKKIKTTLELKMLNKLVLMILFGGYLYYNHSLVNPLFLLAGDFILKGSDPQGGKTEPFNFPYTRPTRLLSVFRPFRNTSLVQYSIYTLTDLVDNDE